MKKKSTLLFILGLSLTTLVGCREGRVVPTPTPSAIPTPSVEPTKPVSPSVDPTKPVSPSQEDQLQKVYELYVRNGGTLSYEAWLETIQGKTAYEVYLETHPDYHKSEAEWLDDLLNGRLVEKEYHTVIFDSNGGTSVESQTVERGDRVDKPNDPTREGYTFDGWTYNDEDWVFYGFGVYEDITLVAKWIANEYTVQFVNDDGSLLYETTAYYDNTVAYPYDDPKTTMPREHYMVYFDGWDKDLVVKGDMVFTAKYQYIYIDTTAYYYDYDGTLLATVELAEGEKPSYPYDNPTREDDEQLQLQYTFYKWDQVEITDDTIAFVANYASCTMGLDIVNDTVDYYHGTSTHVEIPAYWNGVDIKRINENAFTTMPITEVVIPDGITSIEYSAFKNCKQLQSVTMGDSVELISTSVFEGCELLSSIDLSNKLETIGSSAFYYCYALTSIAIPDSVTEIGPSAFNSCTSLTSVTIGNSVKTIASSAFQNCRALTSIVIPDSVNSIQTDVFYNCISLESVTFGSGVTSIGSRCFSCCYSLTSIVIPETVSYLYNQTFNCCYSLELIYIGSNITGMDGGIFDCCHNLIIYCENAYKPKDWNLTWNSYGCPVIWGHSDQEIQKEGLFEYVTVGNTAYIVSIGDTDELNIPVSTESGDLQYVLCAPAVKKMDSIKDKTLKSFMTSDGVAILGNLFQKERYEEGMGYYYNDGSIFRDNDNLESFIIGAGSGITSVPSNAFSSCNSLKTADIPETVTYIGSYAFSSCTSLKLITIPTNVTEVQNNVFYECNDLTIYCEAESQPSGWYSYWNENNRPVIWGAAQPRYMILLGDRTSYLLNNCDESTGEYSIRVYARADERITFKSTRFITEGAWTISNIDPNSTDIALNDSDEPIFLVDGAYDIVVNLNEGEQKILAIRDTNASFSINLSADSYAWTEYNGVYTSGNGGVQNSTSSMEVTIEGSGTFSFEYKSYGEGGCDYLIVYKNGEEIINRSGSSSASFYSYEIEVEAGDVIRFTFRKDGSVNSYDDNAQIRNLMLQ